IGTKLDYGLLAEGHWTDHAASPPPAYVPETGDTLTLETADLDAPSRGYGAFMVARPGSSTAAPPYLLSRFDVSGVNDTWSSLTTGSDALDFTGAFGALEPSISSTNLRAADGSLWIGANVKFSAPDTNGKIVTQSDALVARFDPVAQQITDIWCEPSLQEQAGCDQTLDAAHPAAVPDAVFSTPEGEVALALEANFVDVFRHEEWTRIAAPGYTPALTPLFSAP